MTTFVNNDVASGNVIYAADHNTQGALLAGVLNGNVDSSNLADGAATTAKIADSNVTTAKLADAAVTNAKLSTAAGEINAASATWTPTVTAATGSFTTVSATGKYHKIGKRIFFDAIITITAVGTGQGCVFTLPVAASATEYYACSGREDAVSGKMVQGRLTSTTQVGLSNYDNTNPSSNGAIFRLSGCYEIA